MKRARYEDNSTVSVGFLNTASSDVLAAAATTATAYATDTVVRIAPTSADTWIAIAASPTATADTDGSHFIPYGGAQDFVVEAGDKINTTAAICVTPFK